MARSLRGQIVANTLSGWGNKVVRLAVALAVTPWLLARVGKEGYGLIVLFTTLLGFAELADLGLRPALGRDLAEAHARQDLALGRRLYASAQAVYGLIWALLSIGLWMAAPALLAGLGAGQLAEAERGLPVGQVVWTLRLAGVVWLGVAMARPVYMATLTSRHRFDLRNQAEGAATLAAGLGMVAMLQFTTWGLAGWLAVQTATQLLGLALAMRASLRAAPELGFKPAWVDMKAVRALYASGSWLFAQQWVRKAKYDADPFILARYLPLGAVAAYKPGQAVMANLRPLLTTFAGQLYPITTAMAARGEQAALAQLLVRSTRITVLLALPPVIVVGLYAQPLMERWLGAALGPADTALAARALQAWAGLELLLCLEGSAGAVLLGLRHLRPIVLIDTLAALVNVAASIYLAGYAGWGLMGVIYPSLITEGLARPLVALVAARQVGLPLVPFAWRAWGTPLLLGTLALGLGLVVRHLLPQDTLPGLALSATTCGLITAAICLGKEGFNLRKPKLDR